MGVIVTETMHQAS